MNPVYQLYYQKYRQSFRLGSYSGFLRGFSAGPIAPYLAGDSALAQDTMTRLIQTRQTMVTLIEQGFDSERSRTLIEHMNRAHRHISLGAEHYLYIMANIVIDPLRVLRQYSKQRLSKEEKQQFLAFWQQVALRMGINEVPMSFIGWLKFRNQYERKFEKIQPSQRALVEVCVKTLPSVSLPLWIRKPFMAALPWLIPIRMCTDYGISRVRWGRGVLSLLRWARLS